jgi:hypothetical protein
VPTSREDTLQHATDCSADRIIIDRHRRHYLMRDALQIPRAPRRRDSARVILNSTSWKSGAVIDVRFTPDATKLLRSSQMTRWAILGHRPDYLITSSATLGGQFRDTRPNHLLESRNDFRKPLVLSIPSAGIARVYVVPLNGDMRFVTPTVSQPSQRKSDFLFDHFSVLRDEIE